MAPPFPHDSPPVPLPLDQYAQAFDDLFRTHIQRRRFREYLAGLLLPRPLRQCKPCWMPLPAASRSISTSVFNKVPITPPNLPFCTRRLLAFEVSSLRAHQNTYLRKE